MDLINEKEESNSKEERRNNTKESAKGMDNPL